MTEEVQQNATNHVYEIRQIMGGRRLTHRGEKTYRNIELLVDGKPYKKYRDGAAPFYKYGDKLDRQIMEEVNKMVEFFGGEIKIVKRPDQEKFTGDP